MKVSEVTVPLTARQEKGLATAHELEVLIRKYVYRIHQNKVLPLDYEVVGGMHAHLTKIVNKP